MDELEFFIFQVSLVIVGVFSVVVITFVAVRIAGIL